MRTPTAAALGLTAVLFVAGLPGSAVASSTAATATAVGVTRAESASPTEPAAAPAAGRVASRGVTFQVRNTSEGGILSCGDGRQHRVRGRLVGPPRALDGGDATVRVNVLVHDAGTGGWFWNLPGRSTYDYAERLAARGQTSLVVDRLGYDASRLRDGDGSCLDAQAFVLHQMVQQLYSGRYDWARGGGSTPHAVQVVLHGHGTGATLAQLESARYDDVAGLVLMSVPTGSSGGLAGRILADQVATCRSGRDYASFGSAAEFRRVMFAGASRMVRSAALRRRNPTPCGDVGTTVGAVLSSSSSAGGIEVPVLVLSGSRDRRAATMTRDQAQSRFSSARRVSAVVLRGAGSALPLERSAPRVQRIVGRWLGRLRPGIS